MEKYILLDATDTLHVGDEIFLAGKWLPIDDSAAGYKAFSPWNAIFRRKATMGDRYVLLNPGDEVLQGDDVLVSGQWVKIMFTVGWGDGAYNVASADDVIRRKQPAVAEPKVSPTIPENHYVLLGEYDVIMPTDEWYSVKENKWVGTRGNLFGKYIGSGEIVRRLVSSDVLDQYEYRLLKQGEIVEAGDEFYSAAKTWKETSLPGIKKDADISFYRRRIKPREVLLPNLDYNPVGVGTSEPFPAEVAKKPAEKVIDEPQSNCICPAGSDNGCKNEIHCLRRGVKAICEENDGLRNDLDKLRQEYRDLVDSFEALRKEKLELAHQVRQKENDWKELDAFCKDQAESITYYRELSEQSKQHLIGLNAHIKRQDAKIGYLQLQMEELERVKDGLARQLAQERNPEDLE